MSGELEAAITQIRNTLADITGLRSAPTKPTEQAAAYPFLIVSPDSGQWEWNDNLTQLNSTHNITIEIHQSRNDLPRDIEKIEPYGELVKDKLFKQGNELFTNAINRIGGPVTYTFGPIGYGGVPTIGWIITIPIEIGYDETSSGFQKGVTI